MPDQLPFAALFKNPSGTSKAAAESFEEEAGTLREQVYEAIASRGLAGLTCDELEEAFDGKHQTISPRFWELHKAARILPTGEQRRTRSGRLADVFIASTIATPTSSLNNSPTAADALLERYRAALGDAVAALRDLRTEVPALRPRTGTALGVLLQLEEEARTLSPQD